MERDLCETLSFRIDTSWLCVMSMIAERDVDVDLGFLAVCCVLLSTYKPKPKVVVAACALYVQRVRAQLPLQTSNILHRTIDTNMRALIARKSGLLAPARFPCTLAHLRINSKESKTEMMGSHRFGQPWTRVDHRRFGELKCLPPPGDLGQ